MLSSAAHPITSWSTLKPGRRPCSAHSTDSGRALCVGCEKRAKLLPEEEEILKKKWSQKITMKGEKSKSKSKAKQKQAPNQHSSVGAVLVGQATCQLCIRTSCVLAGKEVEFYLRKTKPRRGKQLMSSSRKKGVCFFLKQQQKGAVPEE